MSNMNTSNSQATFILTRSLLASSWAISCKASQKIIISQSKFSCWQRLLQNVRNKSNFVWVHWCLMCIKMLQTLLVTRLTSLNSASTYAWQLEWLVSVTNFISLNPNDMISWCLNHNSDKGNKALKSTIK